MNLHRTKLPTGDRFSLNGTKEELRVIRDRLDATLAQMDEHEAAMDARAAARNDDRPRPPQAVDFHLDGIATLEEV